MRFRLLGKRDLVCNCFLGFLLVFRYFFRSVCVGIFRIFLSRIDSGLVGICVRFVCIFTVGYRVCSIRVFPVGYRVCFVRVFTVGYRVRFIRVLLFGFCVRFIRVFFRIRVRDLFLGILRRNFILFGFFQDLSLIGRRRVFLLLRLRLCWFFRNLRNLRFLFGIRDVGCIVLWLFHWS